MTTSPQQSAYEDSTKGAFAYGLMIFGAAMLVTIGLFQVFAGFSAILDDEVYATTPNYVFQFDLTAWGWIHLGLGVLAILVGVALMMRQEWAMVAGIAIAVLSALSNFMFLPYYPVWSLVIIGFDVAIIWALTSNLRNA
jgi:hypothetical protein